MTTPQRSANEVAMTVQKACLGAGLPISQAQQWGRAMAACGGASAISDLLGHLETTPSDVAVKVDGQSLHFAGFHAIRDFPLVCDALISGATSASCAGVPDEALQAYASFKAVEISGHDGQMTFAQGQTKTPSRQRLAIDPALWSRLEAFAAKTYVPETDASRLAGAGAGLTDND